MGTKGEGDEKCGNPVRMQHSHARTAVLIIEGIEDSALKLLTGYWAVPNGNNKGDQISRATIKGGFIHPSSFLIIQLHKA